MKKLDWSDKRMSTIFDTQNPRKALCRKASEL